MVVVKRREGRILVTDGGEAVELAGTPPGWREAARRIEDDYLVNVSRQGVVLLQVSPRGPSQAAVEARIAEASHALRDELLELGAPARATARP